jgi:serpin B
MLINKTLDLKFEWKRHFKNLNEKGTFIKSDDVKFSIELMSILKHRFLYSKNPNNLPVKLCEFPFKDDIHVFTILLPEKNHLEKIENTLNDPKIFNELLDQMKYVEVNSVLPKFNIKDTFSLMDIFKQINMIADFDQKGYGLAVGGSFYSSFINVDFSFVNAKCSTNVVLARDSIFNQKNVISHPGEDFNCDNPFLFFIRNKHTRLILFMGKLMVPDYNN